MDSRKPATKVKRVVRPNANVRTAWKPPKDVCTVTNLATDSMGIVKPTADLRMAFKLSDVRRAALEQPSLWVDSIFE